MENRLTDKDLKPCPFCGSEADFVNIRNHADRPAECRVFCKNFRCYAMVYSRGLNYGTCITFIEKEAAAKWNLRNS